MRELITESRGQGIVLCQNQTECFFVKFSSICIVTLILEFDDQPLVASPTIETKVEETVSRQAAFGQAWQWFKERRRITSPPIRAAVTYISVPWYLIISGTFNRFIN